MKKCLAVLAALIVFGVGAFFFSTGMDRRTDVVLVECAVSEDGSTLTLKTALAGSMGYIRDMTAEQAGSQLRCSFYSTFGGLNSRFGAKNVFTVTVDDACTAVCFDRGGGLYEMMLERSGPGGEWKQR